MIVEGDHLCHAVSVAAPALWLDEPLSFWGGVDPERGDIVDVHHPQLGVSITGRALIMPSGRGSSSSATALAEMIRLDTAPASILLGERDAIVAVGAVVAHELYGRSIAVVHVSMDAIGGLASGQPVEIGADGSIRFG